jgi:hypothetical protein
MRSRRACGLLSTTTSSTLGYVWARANSTACTRRCGPSDVSVAMMRDTSGVSSCPCEWCALGSTTVRADASAAQSSTTQPRHIPVGLTSLETSAGMVSAAHARHLSPHACVRGCGRSSNPSATLCTLLTGAVLGCLPAAARRACGCCCSRCAVCRRCRRSSTPR